MTENTNNTNKNDTSEKILNKNKFVPNSKYFTIVIYGLLFVFGTTLIFMLIGNFGQTLSLLGDILNLISPFLVGVFIAFILYPLVKFLYYKVFTGLFKIKSEKLAKWLSIILAYLCAAGVIAILCVFVIPQIYDSISEITVQIPIWYENVVLFVKDFEQIHPEIGSYIDFDALNEHIQALFPAIIDNLSSIMSSLIPKVFSTSVAIVKAIFNFIIAIMVSIYMIADFRNIFYHGKRLLYAALPTRFADKTRKIIVDCSRIFSNFIFGKALDSLIIGILCFVCMSIFRFPFAVLISIIVGFTNMIPFFGPYIGGIIGFLFIIIVNPIKALFFALLILVIQQFDGLFLGPHILGDKVGLNPLWVIFSITIGGSLFGVVGMFLGTPCFAVIAYIVNLIVEAILKKKNVKVIPYESEDKM